MSEASQLAGLSLNELREREHQQRLNVMRLRREVYDQPDPAASAALLKELQAQEAVLNTIQKRRAEVQAQDPASNGLILDTRGNTKLLGPETTGITAQVHVRMAQVPTAIYHLLRASRDDFLVSCVVQNTRPNETRRLRFSAFIDGYSAHAVDTAEFKGSKPYEFKLLPSLFPDRIRQVTELTRATLNVQLEDLDGKVELQKTEAIWLLARTTAPLAVEDPKTGQWRDLTPYLGAFVTPNAPELMRFLRTAASHHPAGRLIGYQGGEDEIEPQVRSLFEALKAEGNITYVNSVVQFSPEEGSANQRVRLPRESLQDQQANCIDGTVLVASLLEGISLNPAIVLVPGHAFVAWETQPKSNTWRFLETTMIKDRSFEDACASAETMAAAYQEQAKTFEDPYFYRLWSLRQLRGEYGITPME